MCHFVNQNTIVVPKYFAYSPRKLNIALTQLRCTASFLNYDLSKVNIVNDQSCICGFFREDAHHYFFECARYVNLRVNLFDHLNWLPNDCNLDLKLITCGNDSLTNEQNEQIFKHVFEYIKKSNRFLIV